MWIYLHHLGLVNLINLTLCDDWWRIRYFWKIKFPIDQFPSCMLSLSAQFIAGFFHVVEDLIVSFLSDLSLVFDFLLCLQSQVSDQFECFLLVLLCWFLEFGVFLLAGCQLCLNQFCDLFLVFFSFLTCLNYQLHQWWHIFFQSWWNLAQDWVSEFLFLFDLLLQESGFLFDVVNKLVFFFLPLTNFWLYVHSQLLAELLKLL